VERERLTYGLREVPCYAKLLTPKLIRQFYDLLKRGHTIDAVCDFLGVGPTNFWGWKVKGQAFLDTEDPSQRIAAHEIYAHFVLETKKALAEYRFRVTRRAHDPFNRTRQVDLAILERRDRKNYSKQDPSGGLDENFDPDEKFI
jgi:hypothetical protein